jgi:hypothetical protein
MSKGEIRKLRKEARESGTNLEFENGRPVFVRPRTRREETRHQERMVRVAKLVYDYDRDF